MQANAGQDNGQPTPASPEPPNMCTICHSEPPVNPVQLECGHIFCYLCIKSVSETSGMCALCRHQIGPEFNFQSHPIVGAVTKVPNSTADGKYWFYEGYRGWWLYDADTNDLIERAHASNLTSLNAFIAGHLYRVDLHQLSQQRLEGEGRARKICRSSLAELDNIIGLAGIRGHEFDDILDLMRSAPALPTRP